METKQPTRHRVLDSMKNNRAPADSDIAIDLINEGGDRTIQDCANYSMNE